MIYLYIALYFLVIPGIIFNINDYFAGYYGDSGGQVYGDNPLGAKVGLHIGWPIFTVIIICIWASYVFKPTITKVKAKLNKLGKDWGIRFSSFEAGKAKKKQDTDLDYHAEKHLLGKK